MSDEERLKLWEMIRAYKEWPKDNVLSPSIQLGKILQFIDHMLMDRLRS